MLSGPGERGHDQVAAAQPGHLGADVLDDADELVPHGLCPARRPAGCGTGADRCRRCRRRDAHDRVGGLLQHRVRHIHDAHVAGAIHQCCSHGPSQRGFGAPWQWLSFQVTAVPPTTFGMLLTSTAWTTARNPRLSDLPPRQDHPRAGGAARVRRQPPGGRAAPRGSRPARRRQRRLLHPPGARQPRRRLRQRPRRARPRTATRRGRTGAPVRPGPRRQPSRRSAGAAGAQPGTSALACSASSTR